ncbi:MAG: tetratricopeptide repeat protein [Burkholderiales bacterium]|nr:tetratricopeptide repeat protein [Burkholderiales bacterium]
MQIDREVNQSTALVVDGNPITRSVLMQQLRDFGFGTVRMAGRVIDARDMLEHRRFDLVVCDYEFDGSKESGQDLLEELRREQMLPYSTVFVMMTGEATYQNVSEAAESALDSYLVKPFSANTLFERIKEARQRKRVLKDIFEAIEGGRHEEAATLCLERFENRQIYWLYAARIGAELLLTLGRHDEAKKLYDAVIAAKTVPWARLGVARAQLADGEVTQARKTLESLIAETPQYADSYDVLGGVLLEQGQLNEAMSTYRAAATITPDCILRLQHFGTLSFYSGDSETAAMMLERTWAVGNKSRLYDVLSMMLLALLRFDARDAKGLDVAVDVTSRFARNYPQSVRLKRMANLTRALATINAGDQAGGLAIVREAYTEAPNPNFDMEAATNTVSVWSRLQSHGISAAEYEDVVRTLARRFTVSKAATEVLAAAALHAEAPARWIRETYAEVMKLAQDSMNHAVKGEPKAAVENLIRHGQDTGNAKLIEMAGLVAKRHRANIAGVDDLIADANRLAHRYCMPSSHIAGVRRSNRSAGGLVLRR